MHLSITVVSNNPWSDNTSLWPNKQMLFAKHFRYAFRQIFPVSLSHLSQTSTTCLSNKVMQYGQTLALVNVDWQTMFARLTRLRSSSVEDSAKDDVSEISGHDPLQLMVYGPFR